VKVKRVEVLPEGWLGKCHACHLGAVDRVYVEGDIVSTFGATEKLEEYRIPAGRSMALAILDAGASAYICPIGANFGAQSSFERDIATQTGVPLGDVLRRGYHDVVMDTGGHPEQIGVFVTGFVRTPGRFGGSAADSPIDFLVRAGGVDPTRGSYRDIQLMRGGRTVATIDLYRFLLEGRLPAVRMQEGDTLLVGRQRALVGGDGAVRNNYLFEVGGRTMTGRELVDLARPLPAATNAVIQGTRDGRPFSRYLSVRDLQGAALGGVGVGEAGGVAPAYSLISDYFPPRQRAAPAASMARTRSPSMSPASC